MSNMKEKTLIFISEFSLFFLSQQSFDFLQDFQFSWSSSFFGSFLLLLSKALCFFSRLNDEEENSTDYQEVNHGAQEVTISNPVPFQLRNLLQVCSFQNWIEEERSDYVSNQRSDDCSKGVGDDHTPTAKSITFPRNKNSLRSFNILSFLSRIINDIIL